MCRTQVGQKLDIDLLPERRQNRVFEDVGLIMEMLAWCKENGVIFQSFWTLTYSRGNLPNPAQISDD